ASSAHTYRLLIFKDRVAFTTEPAPRNIDIRHQPRNHPAPLRSASLHQQQRNEIMKALFRFVNNIFCFRLKPC
ncbi:hypothetical protein P0D72_32515, partial [Paraburkholderia sediminicola]|uniref:hypothetical protein n=1 Tax=Paraburkholderia sediminicola TaxID=458836 RepID=UPI0038BAC3FB